jgi:hypothetical protein
MNFKTKSFSVGNMSSKTEVANIKRLHRAAKRAASRVSELPEDYEFSRDIARVIDFDRISQDYEDTLEEELLIQEEEDCRALAELALIQEEDH